MLQSICGEAFLRAIRHALRHHLKSLSGMLATTTIPVSMISPNLQAGKHPTLNSTTGLWTFVGLVWIEAGCLDLLAFVIMVRLFVDHN